MFALAALPIGRSSLYQWSHPMIRILLAFFAFGLCNTLSMATAPLEGKVPKETCIQPCFSCANECLTCMKHCRENKMEDTAKECEMCHHACLMCALAVQSKNARAWEACELCEKMCNDCASTCEKGTNPVMKKCAEECRNCVKACAEARK
jgi:hypothetical protein